MDVITIISIGGFYVGAKYGIFQRIRWFLWGSESSKPSHGKINPAYCDKCEIQQLFISELKKVWKEQPDTQEITALPHEQVSVPADHPYAKLYERMG